MPAAAPLVRVIRSGLEESVHAGHVAVCDEEGRLLGGIGDPHHPLFSRSSMKPLQAAVSLGRMGDELPCSSSRARTIQHPLRVTRSVLCFVRATFMSDFHKKLKFLI